MIESNFIYNHFKCNIDNLRKIDMAALNTAKKIFRSFDLFSTSQFLRFEGEGEYKTASGGICSLMVIVVFMTLFMSTAIQTINMQIISWTSTSTLEFDPAETNITISPPDNPFMFAVKMLGVNLNDNVRFFDIVMVDRNFKNGVYEQTPKFIEMVPCTVQHFSLTDQIQSFVVSKDYKNWLCPPIGFSFNLKGKYTSADMKLLEIRIKECNNSKDTSRPCASNATLDFYQQLFEQFVVGLVHVNPLINPGDQKYLSYYLEDQSYVRFTRKLGSDSNGRIEDYTIETDVSLLPFAQNVVEKGVIIPQIFQSIAFQVTDNRYASFMLMKSSRSTSYSRSFNKLDSFFSYVGGLVGTILGFMFLVASFTNMAYELDLSQRICRYKEDKKNDFTSFSLFSYFLFVIYKIVKLCGLGKQLTAMQQADECSEEVAKQLDVQLMLQRLLFLERATQAMLEEHQLQGLHLHRLDTLKQIKRRRKRYSLRHDKQDDTESEEQQQNHQKQVPQQNNNGTNVLSNSSKPQLLLFQGQQNNLISNSNNSSLVQMQPMQPNQPSQVVIRRLKEQAELGNAISRRILQGIDDIKPISNLTKQMNNSSQVIKVDPLQFQFIN